MIRISENKTMIVKQWHSPSGYTAPADGNDSAFQARRSSASGTSSQNNRSVPSLFLCLSYTLSLSGFLSLSLSFLFSFYHISILTITSPFMLTRSLFLSLSGFFLFLTILSRSSPATPPSAVPTGKSERTSAGPAPAARRHEGSNPSASQMSVIHVCAEWFFPSACDLIFPRLVFNTEPNR